MADRELVDGKVYFKDARSGAIYDYEAHLSGVPHMRRFVHGAEKAEKAEKAGKEKAEDKSKDESKANASASKPAAVQTPKPINA